ncbi:hypothetical protein M493_02865 [Geobacillus genomosp. 3]|uniref:Uncharacterized protein n=1 Tax=Geobacillus genomosp. 3 TaxID=1921421 RepID=S5YW42_GEOG3|nr:hypothetical protein M493_02865 [Geobacillus genomosp. 3]
MDKFYYKEIWFIVKDFFIPSKLDNRCGKKRRLRFSLSSSGRHRLATLRSCCGGDTLHTLL